MSAGAPLDPAGLHALLLERNPLGLAHIVERRIQWVNPRWAEILGLSQGQLAGGSMANYHLNQAAFASFGQEAYPVLARGERYAADIRLRRVDGSPFWAHLTGSLLVPGRPEAGAIWSLEDVTARVEAHEDLTEVLTLNQKLIASSPTGILLFRATDGACLLVNEAACQMAGTVSGNLLKQSFRRLESWQRSGVLAAAERALDTGQDQRLETRMISSYGRDFWIDAQFVPFVSRGERLLLVMAVDISERFRASQELAASQERYRVVVDALNEGLAIVDTDLRFSFVNDRLASMLGYAAEEILGQPESFILHPEDRLGVEERQRQRPQGARDVYEVRLRRKDGATLHALLSVAPVQDAQGNPVASPVLVTDISERKQAEREREELLLELRQKNKELETLVYVASHDLRSPLVNIQGFSQRLGKGLEELKRRLEGEASLIELKAAMLPLLQERMPAALDYIRASGVKMDAIINGLLRLSRAGRMQLRSERLDMDQLLRACEASLAFQLQSVQGETRMAPLPPCTGDPAQIAQVFSNLLDNAIKYRHPGRALRILVSAEAAAGEVIYSVEDNGLGIPAEHRERIWEIFQRLDPTGPTVGEGLGLTLVRRMVERNGGRIWLESAAGEGCRFRVALPAG